MRDPFMQPGTDLSRQLETSPRTTARLLANSSRRSKRFTESVAIAQTINPSLPDVPETMTVARSCPNCVH